MRMMALPWEDPIDRAPVVDTHTETYLPDIVVVAAVVVVVVQDDADMDDSVHIPW